MSVALQEFPLTKVRDDEHVHFGDLVQIAQDTTGVVLSGDVMDKVSSTGSGTKQNNAEIAAMRWSCRLMINFPDHRAGCFLFSRMGEQERTLLLLQQPMRSHHLVPETLSCSQSISPGSSRLMIHSTRMIHCIMDRKFDWWQIQPSVVKHWMFVGGGTHCVCSPDLFPPRMLQSIAGISSWG